MNGHVGGGGHFGRRAGVMFHAEIAASRLTGSMIALASHLKPRKIRAVLTLASIGSIAGKFEPLRRRKDLAIV